jgi:hypothetical protein
VSQPNHHSKLSLAEFAFTALQCISLLFNPEDEMPNWTPNWHDVQFDQVAAQEYVDAATTLARDLDTWLNDRAGQARLAQKHWKGPHRQRFDTEFAKQQSIGGDLVDDLRRSAHSVQQAAHDAKVEQAHRVSDRERWRTEEAAEIRAAQEAQQAEAARQELARRQVADLQATSAKTTENDKTATDRPGSAKKAA